VDDEPYIKIAAVDKYKPIIDNLPGWISSYYKAVGEIGDLVEKIGEIPG